MLMNDYTAILAYFSNFLTNCMVLFMMCIIFDCKIFVIIVYFI